MAALVDASPAPPAEAVAALAASVETGEAKEGPGITWYAPGTDKVVRTESGELRFHMVFIYVGNRMSSLKLESVVGDPDRISGKTLRLMLKDGHTCAIRCSSSRDSSSFEAQLIKNLAKKRPKPRPVTPRSASPAPSSAELQPTSCDTAPSAKPRPWRYDDDIGEMYKTNKFVGGHRSVKVATGSVSNIESRLQSAGRQRIIQMLKAAGKPRCGASPTPPSNTSISSERFDVTPEDKTGSDSERKRRILDDLTLEHGTPAKAARSASTSYPVRAPPRATAPILFAGRSASSGVPVSSSSYNGYRLQSFGLRNLGNTCYLNAVMQALCAMREFVQDLRDMPRIIPPCAQGELFRCTLDILGQMSAAGSSTGPLSPAKLRERIGRASPMFAGNEQQDAHEFFLEYVNQLHDELLAARIAHFPPDEVSNGFVAMPATQAHFDAQVVKKLVCQHCQHQREVHERFRDFSLDFAQPNTLRRMLSAYFDEEVLQVACEKCGEQEARMEKRVASSPEVLVLHLKRFVPNMETQRYDKLNQAVEFPAEFTLSEYIKPYEDAAAGAPRMPARPLSLAAKGDGRYHLRAAVAHQGASPQSGHYVCYAKSGAKDHGVWRLYDDSMVQDLPQLPMEEMGKKAYILFYVRGHSTASPASLT